MTLRPYTSADLPALHAINVAGEPGVGAVSEARLGEIIGLGTCLIAEGSAGPEGFILLIEEDTAYDSQNYLWFAERYESFVYVDRIAIAASVRGQGLGGALYRAAFKAYAGKALLIGCEVHTVPPNPRSQRFHKALGFDPVGTQSFSDTYAVSYLAKRLSA